MATYRGVAVNFGTNGTTITTPALTGIFTTRDYARKADIDPVRDGDGVITAKVYYNPYEEASFTYVPTGAHNSASLAITAGTNLPNIGDLATVADTTNFTIIAGTTWLVEDMSVKSTNTGHTSVDLKLVKHGSITS